MSNYYNAFEISPVPNPEDDTVPEPYRGIYAMPMFVSIPTSNMEVSEEFWTEGLGFINIFSVPGQIIHLRKWAFQDVLLVPAQEGQENPQDQENPQGQENPQDQEDSQNEEGSRAQQKQEPPAMTTTFACVLSQLDGIVESCERLRPGSTEGPTPTWWNTHDVTVLTPENVRVIMSAAVQKLDPESEEAKRMAEIGIFIPDEDKPGAQ